MPRCKIGRDACCLPAAGSRFAETAFVCCGRGNSKSMRRRQIFLSVPDTYPAKAVPGRRAPPAMGGAFEGGGLMPRRIQIIAADAVNRQLLQALLGGTEAVLEKAPAAPPEEGSVPPDAPPLSLHRLSGPEGRKTGVWLCETGALSALEGRPAYILALTDPGSGWTEGAPRCSEEALRQALAGWGRRVCI